MTYISAYNGTIEEAIAATKFDINDINPTTLLLIIVVLLFLILLKEK